MVALSIQSLPAELTTAEQERFEANERVIAFGWEMWLEACRALRDQHDSRLYRGKYRTWPEYVETRWSHLFQSYQTADRWIQAANVQDQLTPIGVMVERESHARELAKIMREYQPEIMQAVALVGARAAEIEQRKPTRGHFREAGALMAEMVATGAIDIGGGAQHAATEHLAMSVVEARRRDLTERIERHASDRKVCDVMLSVRGTGADPYVVFRRDDRLEIGKTYRFMVYEVQL